MFDKQKFKLTLTACRLTLWLIYFRMKRQGLLGQCFPFEAYSAWEFVRLMTACNHCYIVSYNKKTIGFCWLNRWEHRTVRINFCAFKSARNILVPALREAAERLVWMKLADGSYYCDCLLGYIHESNRMSRKAAEKAGFIPVGVIPCYYPNENNVAIYAKRREP